MLTKEIIDSWHIKLQCAKCGRGDVVYLRGMNTPACDCEFAKDEKEICAAPTASTS